MILTNETYTPGHCVFTQPHNPTPRCSWLGAAAGWRGHEVVYRALDAVSVAGDFQVNVGGKFPLPVRVDGIVGILLHVHADCRSVIGRCECAGGGIARPIYSLGERAHLIIRRWARGVLTPVAEHHVLHVRAHGAAFVQLERRRATGLEPQSPRCGAYSYRCQRKPSVF